LVRTECGSYRDPAGTGPLQGNTAAYFFDVVSGSETAQDLVKHVDGRPPGATAAAADDDGPGLAPARQRRHFGRLLAMVGRSRRQRRQLLNSARSAVTVHDV
jgi:hypothetical protein